MKGLKVYKDCCNKCLFSKNRIVSKERAAEIIKDCKKRQSYFVCHKSPDGEDIMCSSYYKQLGKYSQLLRIAERLRVVKFVDQNKEQ